MNCHNFARGISLANDLMNPEKRSLSKYRVRQHGGIFHRPSEFELMNRNRMIPLFGLNGAGGAWYQIPESAHVAIHVFNILGKKVGTLVNSVRPKGFHMISGIAAELPGGHYILSFETGDLFTMKTFSVIR